MKITRWLTLGCLFTALVCGGQEITEPGWYNAFATLEPDTNPPPENYTAEAPGMVTYPEIAEASSPEIEALARGLEDDPKRIFDYVHDHIRHVLYFGSKKGAQLTLLERSGNDFDQCALLVALLRAAGYEATNQFAVLEMPLDATNHYDLHHWLELSLVNTNWAYTKSYLNYVLGSRGYPYVRFPGGTTNAVQFHRVWVKLTAGGTNYYLDPAFKISEPVTNFIDLDTATGLSTNALLSAAGGTVTSDYVQYLNEASLRNKLRDYTSNLLDSIESGCPNASAEEVLGGWHIVSSADEPLSQSQPFAVYTAGGQMPVQDWAYQPTNLMSRLSISLAGTNYEWFIPELQGERLSMTFDSSGVGKLWQGDTNLLQVSTSGGRTIPVALSVNHPHGSWDVANNTLNNSLRNDQTFTANYQRTNATYALMYGFEVSSAWLRDRQQHLDEYRRQGLADNSREVMSETLNVMGLNWLLQAGQVDEIIAEQTDTLYQQHHALGRMAQEEGRGYYVDVVRLTGLVPDNDNSSADIERLYSAVDVMAYFSSALEHGVIEQMQSGDLIAASTIKMLQLGNTNGLRTYLVNEGNWSTVSPQLVNYSLSYLYYYITNDFNLLLPADGAVNIAGPGSWGGYGGVGLGYPNGYRATKMFIAGAYFGGYVSDEDAEPDPDSADTDDQNEFVFDPNGLFLDNSFSAEPVDLASGAYSLDHTDLTLGQAEPRGLRFSRHYSSNRRYHNPAGMADGWTHNYFFKLAETSSPEISLGRTTPSQMAPILVATRAASELYRTNTSPQNWMVTALIAKWGVDQLLKNSVSITLGKDNVQFVRQPDGRFTPPANCTMTLLKTNSAYWLQQRHGNTFKFSIAGQLTNIVDQYNKGLTLTYGTGAASNWVTQAKDWKDRTLTLSYTGNPLRLTSVSDNTSRSVSFGYTTTGGQLDLASATDPEQKTRNFYYDTNHQMTAVEDALNRLVASNVYDGFGRVVTQYSQGDTDKAWTFFWTGFENVEQDPEGGRRTFYFDDKSRQIGMQDALGNVSQTFYDGQDHVVMTVSPLDEANKFIYDGHNNLVFAVDPLGNTNQFDYDNEDILFRTVDARGGTNTFGYNSKFQLTGQTNGVGDWVSFDYNADGTLHTRTDPGGSTSYGYDSWGQLSGVTYPGSLGSEGYLNNARGDILSHTNSRQFVTSFQYNARRQLTNTIAPTNVTTKVAFDDAGNVQSRTDARQAATTYAWSATRKLLSTTLPATPQGSLTTSNTYDSRDWLLMSSNNVPTATLYTNDAAQRLLSVTDPLKRTTRFGYDDDGRRVAATNALQEAAHQEWSARGKLLKSVDGASHTVNYTFDPAGNQITLTNRRGKPWQFRYDAANRLTNTISPLGKETRITYNNRGLVYVVREPSTQMTTNLYDARGRLTNRVDQVAPTRLRYDANNNVTNIIENGKTNTWTFDAFDRVQTYRDADGNLLQYRYDANGNLTNLVYPGNRNVFYAYDSRNHLTNVTDWADRKTSFEYDLAGRVRKIIRPNTSQRIIDYDAAGQATNIVEKFTNNFPVAFFRLHWNEAARAQWEFAAPLPHAWTPPNRTMTYDDDNRIDTFNSNPVNYDDDGNLTSGPLTNSASVSYGYNARNQLTNVAGVSYGYDPAGNRTSVTNGATVAEYVINPNAPLSQVLMRIRPGVTNYYIHGLGLLYEITETTTNTSTLTYHYDHRGSTVALTDDDGHIADRIEYSAYGQITYRAASIDTPFLFNGRYGVQTDDNGLLYMRARYYNPFLCRFLNADPSGFSGGLNFFAYGDGNPVSLIDPFGLGSEDTDFWSWLTQAGIRFATSSGVDPTGISSHVLMTFGLIDKYALSGYGAENGLGNTSLMIAGEFAGTTPFAEGWHGVDIGYGTSLTTSQSFERLLSGGATMAGWVLAGYAGAHGFGAESAGIRISEGISGSKGTSYFGGFDPTTGTLHLGAEGHFGGMQGTGGTPLPGATPGISVLETPTRVIWANDSLSLPVGLTAEQAAQVQAALESQFPGKVVTQVPVVN